MCEAKTIHPEIKLNLEMQFEQVKGETGEIFDIAAEEEKEKVYKPLYQKYNENNRMEMQSLNSIKELTGEETNTTGKSSARVIQFKNTDEFDTEELLNSLSQVSTPKECTEIIEPERLPLKRKDTLDELKTFMQNIENFETLAKSPTKRKDYSNAFLELLNSEIIEDSPKDKKKEEQDLSWNKITDQILEDETISDYSQESNLLTNIDDFLKANKDVSFKDKMYRKILTTIVRRES